MLGFIRNSFPGLNCQEAEFEIHFGHTCGKENARITGDGILMISTRIAYVCGCIYDWRSSKKWHSRTYYNCNLGSPEPGRSQKMLTAFQVHTQHIKKRQHFFGGPLKSTRKTDLLRSAYPHPGQNGQLFHSPHETLLERKYPRSQPA